MSKKDRLRSEAAKKAWATRRHAATCSRCGKHAKLYAVPDLHPVRDLCLDCAFAVGEQP